MQSLLKHWKHFIHELDPPRRLGEVPPSLLIALGLLVLGILAAIIFAYVARK